MPHQLVGAAVIEALFCWMRVGVLFVNALSVALAETTAAIKAGDGTLGGDETPEVFNVLDEDEVMLMIDSSVEVFAPRPSKISLPRFGLVLEALLRLVYEELNNRNSGAISGMHTRSMRIYLPGGGPDVAAGTMQTKSHKSADRHVKVHMAVNVRSTCVVRTRCHQ